MGIYEFLLIIVLLIIKISLASFSVSSDTFTLSFLSLVIKPL